MSFKSDMEMNGKPKKEKALDDKATREEETGPTFESLGQVSGLIVVYKI